MPDVQEVFRMATQKVRPEPDFVGRQQDLQRRRARNRQLGVLGLVAVITIVGAVVLFRSLATESRPKPAIQPSPSTATVPQLDYALDLETGEIKPLPAAIVGGTGKTDDLALSRDGSMLAYVAPGDDGNSQIFVANLDGTSVRQLTHDQEAYAPTWSPDGARIAYVAPGDDGNYQIFVADLDGTSVRQLTHDPEAYAPTWSPDGTKLAYAGYGDGAVTNLFVVELSNGEATQVTSFETEHAFGIQFTPDGSALIYSGGDDQFGIRLAPTDGGKHPLLVGGGGDRGRAFDGAMSPDGSLLTYTFTSPETDVHPDRYVSNADGSDPRPLVTKGARLECDPDRTWSSDSTRIACSNTLTHDIVVIDIATATERVVATGTGAIWLDDRTLLIDV